MKSVERGCFALGDILLAELLKYFKGVADKYGLRKHIRFETLVETCGVKLVDKPEEMIGKVDAVASRPASAVMSAAPSRPT